MTDNLIERLSERLQKPLPGLDVQMEMAPRIRTKDYKIPDDVRLGGVLALLYPKDEDWYLVLMQRTDDGGTHSGQVSFPGGRVEPEDKDKIHTALRETEEEIGVKAEEITILGSLTPLYIPPSNFMVYPALGFVPAQPTYVPDPVEVAKVLEVNLRDFMDEKNSKLSKVPFSGQPDMTITTPAYCIEDYVIWGATAMMLRELMEILKEVDFKPV